MLLRGLVAIIFGLLAIFLPGITITAFILLFGAFAIDDGLLLVSGILAIAIGVLLVVRPGIGLIALVQTIDIFAIAYGIMIAVLGLRLRSLVHKATPV
jgi:uncharacterized membrane protein HdeD (DUF308 family)